MHRISITLKIKDFSPKCCISEQSVYRPKIFISERGRNNCTLPPHVPWRHWLRRCNCHSIFGFLSALKYSLDDDDDVSADRFDAEVLSQAFIMLALGDDLLHFASSLLHITKTCIHTDIHRATRSKKWNFRTQCLQNFRTISGHFCQFHEAQKTEKCTFFLSLLCYLLKQISIAVLKMLLRHCYEHTKAKL